MIPRHEMLGLRVRAALAKTFDVIPGLVPETHGAIGDAARECAAGSMRTPHDLSTPLDGSRQ
jgi:hypothetical protein